MMGWINSLFGSCCSERRKHSMSQNGPYYDIIADAPVLPAHLPASFKPACELPSVSNLPTISPQSTAASISSPLEVARSQLSAMKCSKCTAPAAGFCPLCREFRYCRDCYQSEHVDLEDHWLEVYPEFRIYRRRMGFIARKDTKKKWQ